MINYILINTFSILAITYILYTIDKYYKFTGRKINTIKIL